MIKLSVIVLSWNTKELLRQCLGSMPKMEEGRRKMEIVVVDNASTDGSSQVVKKEFPQVKLIQNRQNLGFAKGNNIGLKQAKGEYLMLLNSDTIVQSRGIEKLVEFLERKDKGMVANKGIAESPQLVLPDGKPQIDYYMRFPNLWQVLLYHNPILRPMIMKIPFLKLLIAQQSQEFPFMVDQLPGAALIASREVWGRVGLLDEDYQFLFEDVDWCWRAKKVKIRLMVVPEAKIIHIGGASWKKKLKENSSMFYYQFFSSMLLFVRKNYSQVAAKIFKWAIILNFLFTLKPLLAWQFWKENGRQLSFLK